MIKPKYSNNEQSFNCSGNYNTQKKEEKILSQISINDLPFQPLMIKSGFSSKK